MPSSKEEKFDKVYEGVLTLLNSHGGLSSLTPSALSRASGVTRPWIYKYVGTTREDIIQKTSEHYIGELFRERQRPTPESPKALRQMIHQDTLLLLKKAQEHPRLIPLILMYFDSAGPVGNVVRTTIREQAGRVGQHISKQLQLSKKEGEILAELVSVLRLGLAFYMFQIRRPDGGASRDFNIENLAHFYKQFKLLI